MAGGSWAYFDPEYETLSIRINPPRVSVDNTSYKDYTLVKVDSVNRHGILLEVVQILTDLDLIITKAYISSDGGWFMDVFHVTDQQGNKITDETIGFIEKALGPKGQTGDGLKNWTGKRIGVHSVGNHATVELIGRDRPGLLSEVSAVLTNLHFNVLAAEVWTHNMRIACILHVNNDDTTNRAVDDPVRLSILEEQLKNILGGGEDDENVARTNFSMGFTHIDRRLHQMFTADTADRDTEGSVMRVEADFPHFKPKITVERCEEKCYLVVTVQCRDRAKLMFDIVCTLTDMQFVVFHATISSDGPHASQEYYIRHMNDHARDTEGENERVAKCLEAAIQRRASEGLTLELCAKDRVGLLSEATRILRENGLSVTRAGVTTVGEKAVNVFYVRDASGNAVDVKTIETLRKEIGKTMVLNVKTDPSQNAKAPETSGWSKASFFFGSLLERFRT